MLRNTPDRIDIWNPGDGTYFDPDIGDYVDSPPTLESSTRGWFGMLDAETRSALGATYEAVSAFVLVPHGTTVTTTHLVDAGPTGKRWNVRGVEHHRGHTRVLLAT